MEADVNGKESPVAGAAEPDSSELLSVAERAGEHVSARMLETFRAEGLLPRPRRAGNRGRSPLWLSPSGTEDQLLALLRWRHLTNDPQLLKILLWLDGYSFPGAEIRDALGRCLNAMTLTLEKEIGQHSRRLGLDPADETSRARVIAEIAQTLAGKRGATALRRYSRARASDRTEAISLMIRLVGLGENVETTAKDSALLERVLGIAPNGRQQSIDGTGPWLTGPAEELLKAAEIIAIPNLAVAVAAASDAELATARRTVRILIGHLPLMVRLIGAIFADLNFTGLEGLSQLDQHPEVVMFIVPVILGMLRAGWAENLEAVTSALGPFPDLVARLEPIFGMRTATLCANLAGQSPQVRARARRVIEASLDGQLDTGPVASAWVATELQTTEKHLGHGASGKC